MSNPSVTRDIAVHIPGGDGQHRIQFTYWENEIEPYGLIEHHSFMGSPWNHGAYVAWRDPSETGLYQARHELVSGGPLDIEHLTITPSLLCGYRHVTTCMSHGYIRDGAWVDADA